jgi:hypothetical protein
MSDYRRDLDWRLGLLTTLPYDPELQVSTAPSLISTIHKPLPQTLNHLQPAVSSLDVSWQRLLTVEILQLHAFKSSLHTLPYRTTYQLILSLACNISARTTHTHPVSNNTSIVACVFVVAGTCLPSRCLETAPVYFLGYTRYNIVSILTTLLSNKLKKYLHELFRAMSLKPPPMNPKKISVSLSSFSSYPKSLLPLCLLGMPTVESG